jgi:hypothetical protein
MRSQKAHAVLPLLVCAFFILCFLKSLQDFKSNQIEDFKKELMVVDKAQQIFLRLR